MIKKLKNMDDKINIPNKEYNSSTSPIFKYYSNITNPNNENFKSELIRYNAINLPDKRNNLIPPLDLNKNQNEINVQNQSKEKHYTHKNSNFRLKSEIQEINNTTVQEKKEIKKITPDDLIVTQINPNRTILRINPAIYMNESYEFLSYNLYLLLKDQLACKFLQEKLEIDTYNCIKNIFPALIPNMNELIKDPFANYFIQKMFFYLNEEQLMYVLKTIEPDILDISIDSHGTRVIQGIMNLLTTEKLKNLFFDIIKPVYINLINDFFSVHIIYKFLNLFPEFWEVCNNIIIDNIITIATNKRGVVFLENYLSTLYKYYLRQQVIQAILKNCLILIIDPSGNYIIQYLLSFKDSNITLNIINQVINNISFYSKHKYAYYVIQKVLLHSNYSEKQKFLEKITKTEIINDLVFDQKGNFIIIEALNYADDNQKNLILNNVNNLKQQIEESPEGKKFLEKIQNFFKK